MKKTKRKSLLYKTGVEYGDYTINHVLGCSHGCQFPCYAMLLSKRFGKIKTYEDWIEPVIVDNSISLLREEIEKLKDKINFVHLSFMTDPFMMDHPDVTRLTLRIIRELNDKSIKVTALTKGILPKDLIDDMKYEPSNEYGISLVSLDENFRKQFEPHTSFYNDRISALKFLHENDLRTWVSIEPYPTPNIVEQEIEPLLERISFVNKIVFGRMNYNKKVSEYRDYKRFYNETAEIVNKFCIERNIDLHIKEKTVTDDILAEKIAWNKSKNLFKRPDFCTEGDSILMPEAAL